MKKKTKEVFSYEVKGDFFNSVFCLFIYAFIYLKIVTVTMNPAGLNPNSYSFYIFFLFLKDLQMIL